ncbi:acetyl-CoA C-acyltransferase [Falsarthrobacter nasiphocae]|uniref:Probable acetyl-CoA acetyltransferase n=1 Tax=Falsarthrobacter nasiphocae TaxID=189863 RepID=A0AAE4C6T6_9MICC|nr:acetyl-CoA C-acyltransferase [Falsarthrobacter nasiphocae]MDR6892507.1 acetyl-CoA C-acetyltransferase [Falsarthrobacter nasiphocae]
MSRHTPTPEDVVIVGGARTPQGRIMGALSSLSAVELGAAAMAGALSRAGVAPEAVEFVLMGQVIQAGCGQNPAKQAAVAAGVPRAVPAMTLNKVCLSGLSAVIDAARLVRLGDAEVVVAGGMESMSQAPHLLPGSRRGWTYGDVTALDAAARDGLTDAASGVSMGLATERDAQGLAISREDQDRIAAASHTRAAAAAARGAFAEEIVPVQVPQRKGDPLSITDDEGIRPDTTPEGLARLRPAFSPEGTITAASSSPLSDGASALIVTSRRRAEAEGWQVLAAVCSAGQVAGPDSSLLPQPANAIRAALEREGLGLDEVDIVEVNEAFAAVVHQSASLLGLPAEHMNTNGGAIALGHPIGASGARLALTATAQLVRRGEGTAVVALCGGGGQGEALILRR